MKAIISGYSDGIINVDGDLCEEFYPEGSSGLLAFSDGTLLEARYTNGFWTINRLKEGTARYSKKDKAEFVDCLYIFTWKTFQV